MAAINVKSINWNEIAEEVGESSRKSSGMVDVIDQAAREIMKNGGEFTINRIKNIIEKGINEDVPEGEPITVVHWATVSHVLTTHDGFKIVEGKENTFTFDSGVKKSHGKAKKVSVKKA